MLPLRRSRSLKVTDFGINHNFLLVIMLLLILNYLLPCNVLKLWLIIGQIFASNKEVPHFNAPAGVISCECRHKMIYSLKLHSLGYISAAESVSVSTKVTRRGYSLL